MLISSFVACLPYRYLHAWHIGICMLSRHERHVEFGPSFIVAMEAQRFAQNHRLCRAVEVP